MADTIFYIPIYKTCLTCNGQGNITRDYYGKQNSRGAYLVACHPCNGLGAVKILIPLDEFAKEIDLSEEATHNLMCYVRDA